MAGLDLGVAEAPEGLAGPQHMLQVREDGLEAVGTGAVLRSAKAPGALPPTSDGRAHATDHNGTGVGGETPSKGPQGVDVVRSEVGAVGPSEARVAARLLVEPGLSSEHARSHPHLVLAGRQGLGSAVHGDLPARK
eukprot:3414353-Alexandrium_andersonii.AAC.1